MFYIEKCKYCKAEAQFFICTLAFLSLPLIIFSTYLHHQAFKKLDDLLTHLSLNVCS
jgi:hypothetical protein